MADSKITALTALTAADPANDMIPIVDVSDTPPASGNTKRISINNILAASGTATLASATITGAATVGTTLGVTGAATVGTTLLVGTNATLTNGNVILGTSGKGIDFSASPNAPGATSELLNDYEEGTFTPGITFGGANVGMTGTFNGRYTKVGRSVTVNGLILLTAKGSSTGTALITGLPFTSSNAAGSYWSASLRNSAVSFTDVFQGYMGPNSTVIVLEQVTNAGADSVLTASNFTVGLSVLIFSCTYDV